MRQHVVYILDLSMTLTFDLYVGVGVILSEFYSQFLSCLNQFVFYIIPLSFGGSGTERYEDWVGGGGVEMAGRNQLQKVRCMG